ncbi:MAG: hypothetical protein JOY81_00635 [Alphaproteobacteria bacterium]|nr:hypothetical protein [Alphaproteobacteria bacterium]
MKRRDLLFAGLGAGLAVSAGLPARANAGVEMIYVGGHDCTYCTLWRNKYEAAWRASPEFRRVTWIEIDPPHLRDAYQPRYWQGELRPVLDQLPRKGSTPRFLVVRDGEVVVNMVGIYKWPAVLDRLREILG